jgi:hypothetical protein
MPAVLKNNKKIKYPEKVSVQKKLLNSFWTTAESWNLCEKEEEDEISFLKVHFLVNSLVLKLFQPLKLRLKYNTLLKSKYSSGYNEIASKILEACASLTKFASLQIDKHNNLEKTCIFTVFMKCVRW